jgi:hypothetical protein
MTVSIPHKSHISALGEVELKPDTNEVDEVEVEASDEAEAEVEVEVEAIDEAEVEIENFDEVEVEVEAIDEAEVEVEAIGAETNEVKAIVADTNEVEAIVDIKAIDEIEVEPIPLLDNPNEIDGEVHEKALNIVLLKDQTDTMEITYMKEQDPFQDLINEFSVETGLTLTETSIPNRVEFTHRLLDNYALYACQASEQWLKLFYQSVSGLNHFDTTNMSAELSVQKLGELFKLVSLHTGYITNAFRWVFQAQGCAKDRLTITMKINEKRIDLLNVRPEKAYRWTIVIGMDNWKMYTEINGMRTYITDVPHTKHYSTEQYGNLICTGHVTGGFELEDKICDLVEPTESQSWEEYILERTGIRVGYTF